MGGRDEGLGGGRESEAVGSPNAADLMGGPARVVTAVRPGRATTMGAATTR